MLGLQDDGERGVWAMRFRVLIREGGFERVLFDSASSEDAQQSREDSLAEMGIGLWGSRYVIETRFSMKSGDGPTIEYVVL